MKRFIPAKFIIGIVVGWLLCSISNGDLGNLLYITLSVISGVVRGAL